MSGFSVFTFYVFFDRRGAHIIFGSERKQHITIILPAIYFYGCGTWFLTLREEHRLEMFETRVLRRISGCKRD
jgi:hypothetical protein